MLQLYGTLFPLINKIVMVPLLVELIVWGGIQKKVNTLQIVLDAKKRK